MMNKSQIFSPYQTRRAFQEVAEEIKHAILAERFKAGDRLPSERSLAQQFQVGRLTIREALRTLETKGLIKIRYGRDGGAYVGVADPEAIPSMIIDNLQLEGLTGTQMTEARIGLETTIVASAITHATSKDLDRIAENIEDSKEIIGPENAKDVVSAMIDFHILLGEASHNLPFILFIRTLMEWARRKLVSWVPTVEEQLYSYRSHKKIFESIKGKDVDSAQSRMKDHIIRISALVTSEQQP